MKEWLGLHASAAGGPGSTPGVAGGTEILQAASCGQKKKREIKTFFAIRLALEEMF